MQKLIVTETEFDKLQDVVDSVTDEMLAKFVVDSHFKSQPKGVNLDDKSVNESQEDSQESTTRPLDSEVIHLYLIIHHFSTLSVDFCSDIITS